MTTFAVDEPTAKSFRDAVEKKFPGRYGEIRRQIKMAIEERTKALLSE